MRRYLTPGFTIVELLIVIVVIAILAAISIVAYTGIQNRAAEATLKSDLRNASTQLSIDSTETSTFPTGNTVPSSLRPSAGTTFQYSSPTGTTYCLTATSSRTNVPAWHITNTSGLAEGVCSGHGGGGPTGASLIQTQTRNDWTASATVPISTGTGHTLIASIGAGTSSITVTDTAGNTWTQVADTPSVGAVNQRRGSLWYTVNAQPITSITITSASAQNIVAVVTEWTGITGLRGHAVQNTPSSATTTAAQAGDVVWAACYHYRSVVDPLEMPAGWTAAGTSIRTNMHNSNAYQVASSSGSLGPVWATSAGNKATITAAFTTN